MLKERETAVIFARWQRDLPRRRRTFQKLSERHPAAALGCACCPELLGSDEPVTIVVLGPLDASDTLKHESGMHYSAAATLVHTACLDLIDTGDGALDEFARKYLDVAVASWAGDQS